MLEVGSRVRIIDRTKVPGGSHFDDILDGEYTVIWANRQGAKIELSPGIEVYLFNESLEVVRG